MFSFYPFWVLGWEISVIKERLTEEQQKLNNIYTFCILGRALGKQYLATMVDVTTLDTIFSGRQKKALGQGQSDRGVHPEKHSQEEQGCYADLSPYCLLYR